MKLYASDQYLEKHSMDTWDQEMLEDLERLSKNGDTLGAKHILKLHGIEYDDHEDEIYIQENENDEEYERIL